MDTSIEGYYHSALEACAQASQFEKKDRPTEALLEYRRSIALIEAMRQVAHDPLRGTDEAYFSGVNDVEGLCRVHIAKLEGELPALEGHSVGMRRTSSDSLNTMARGELTRTGSAPPRKLRSTPRKSTRERAERPSKSSRSPSPEKDKKVTSFMLRPSGPGPVSAKVSSSESTTVSSASQTAVEASRAATLAWQQKTQNGGKPRNPSPIDMSNVKRPSIPDTMSLLDAPLIDFSAPVLSASSAPLNQQDPFQAWASQTPTLPSQPQPKSYSSPRRKPPHSSNKNSGRAKATVHRPVKPPKPLSPGHPRSASAPDLSDPVEPFHEVSPISVSMSECLTPEQELSREEKALKGLKGVDENLARTIMNDIVVRGDEVQWDDIAGLEEAKTALKETVIYPFLRPDLFLGLREPARGMLLFGPPGTGKTMLARAVATQAKSTFFSVSASTLVSKYLGESEKLVKALFALAKALSPSIIFVDEIDSILTSRSGGENENEASRRLKTEFLIQWSSLASAAAARTNVTSPRVLVLAATNLPWAIDDAARRRFVLRQYIPLPEQNTRQMQFKSLLSRQHHALADEQLEQLVQMTEGFSGSDITALTKDAAMGPLRSLGEALLTTKREDIRAIGFEDFMTSLRKVRPSVSKEGLHAFEKWNNEFGSKG